MGTWNVCENKGDSEITGMFQKIKELNAVFVLPSWRTWNVYENKRDS